MSVRQYNKNKKQVSKRLIESVAGKKPLLAVCKQEPANLNELKRLCQEEWAKSPLCDRLIKSYRK